MAFRRVVISGEKVQDTKTDLDGFFSNKVFKTNYPGLKTKIILSPVKKDTIVVDINGDGADTVAKKVKDIAIKYKMKAVIKLEKPMSAVNENDKEKNDELVNKIKSSLLFQLSGGKKGEPMSKGQNLPANTFIKKSELKEIVKNFNK